MWSIVISLASLLFIINSQYVDVCFWGADDISTPAPGVYQTWVPTRNGLYRYAGEYKTVPFYRLDRTNTTCDQTYFWMYKQDNDDTTYPNHWIISATPPGNDQFFYGACDIATTSPLTCGKASGQTGTWSISGTNQQRAYTQSDVCPIKDCTSITVVVTNSAGGGTGCEGAVTDSEYVQTGPNMFTGVWGSSKYVWWFNPLTFQWICTRTTDSSGNAYNDGRTVPNSKNGVCAPILNDWTVGRKLETANGYEGPFTLSHPDEAGSGATFAFTCVGAGTGATYTKSPTTPRPTIDPTTPIPTFVNVDPIGSPTTTSPTTNIPTTAQPSTDKLTTNIPTTDIPTTDIPTTNIPTTYLATTALATTGLATTVSSTTRSTVSEGSCSDGDTEYVDGFIGDIIKTECKGTNSWKGKGIICKDGNLLATEYNGNCNGEGDEFKCCQEGAIGSDNSAICKKICILNSNDGYKVVIAVWSLLIMMALYI